MRHFQMAKKVWLQFYIVSTNSRTTFMSLNLNDYLQIISAHVLPTFCIVGQNLLLTVLSSTLWRKMPQKVIEGDMSHVKSYSAYDMHEKSRWLKISIMCFTEMAHFFNHKNRDGSKKVKGHVIEILSHLDFSCIWLHVRHVSFDDFLSHLTIPPVKLKNHSQWYQTRAVFWELNHTNPLWTFAWAFQ